MSSDTGNQKHDRVLLILGDQLDPDYLDHAGFDASKDAVLMVESACESSEPASHVQRTVLFLSAMRHHAKFLRKRDVRVDYVRLGETDLGETLVETIAARLTKLGASTLLLIRPGDRRVLDEITSACDEHGIELSLFEDEHFLCPLDDFQEWADGRKELVMEYFYRQQRKTLDVLMDGKDPEGGSWNLDKQNRKSFKSQPDAPTPPSFKPDAITKEVIGDVESALPDLPGKVDRFAWPVTREQALESLDDFITNRLPSFGDYQDAMWTGEHTLYHSLISPAINLKLLNPREVVEAATEAYENGDAPLNAVEGFVRQIIGWREFIRGVYWTQPADYGERNELEQHGDLPSFYWDADTDMTCMKHAITSVLDLAYGHHIARLMLTGNFALIAGVHPRAVTDWYLGMYADAVDWVTLPNTLGMAMHADGGVVGTKPYAASGKYVSRMSNYCKNCGYDVSKRHGEDACPFNVFYWDFLNRNEQRFRSNRRMGMVLKNLDRLDEDELTQITVSAKSLRDRMGIGDIGSPK